MTVVSFAHELIFLKTRKTAGTSVELWLSSVAGTDDIVTALDPDDEQLRTVMGGEVQNTVVPRRRARLSDHLREPNRGRRRFVSHMAAHEVRRYVGERAWRSFLKVSLERDPYERAVSMYRFKTRHLANPPGLVEFLRRFPAYKLANAPIYTIDGEVVADVMLSHARLDDDVAALQRHLGVPTSPLPHAKSYAAPARDVAAMLGPEGRRIVDSICRDDYSLERKDKSTEAVLR